MKYRTFVRLATLGALGAVATVAGGVVYAIRQSSDTTPPVVAIPETTSPPVPLASVPEVVVPVQAAPSQQPRVDLRVVIENWLAEYPDRGERMRAEDVFPTQTYRMTAVRFRPEDAVRFSNDPRQWSQIRIDFDRNGIDDEKWLLRNGHTYKREVLAQDGRTVTSTEWFNRHP
jgi:hypothetical protein